MPSKVRRKPRSLNSLPWQKDLGLELAVAMEYLSDGLVPPAGTSSYTPPQGFVDKSCNIPREARRKFRKKWRQGYKRLQKTTLGKSITEAAVQPGHCPRIKNEQLRRSIVLDEMVQRARKRLGVEQEMPDGVVSTDQGED